ncbi:MAG: LPS assembly lipoprotein LptE [Verrucomicrobiota bacterium]
MPPFPTDRTMPTPKLHRLIPAGALLLLLAACLLPGCAHYRPGAGAELPFDSIYIRPAENESFAPQAQALVSAQIRERFIRDGRVKVLADESEADAVLLVTLTEYDREAGARRGDDTVTATDFDVRLRALVSLYSSEQGGFLFADREIEESTVAYVDNPYDDAPEATQGYHQAEYQAMPRLARDLANRITDEVLGAW